MLKERLIVQMDWDKPGKAVEGYLLSVTRNKYKDGSSGLTYVVRRVDEARVIFKGATRLNFALSPSDVGKYIAVEYLGEDDSKEVAQGMNRPKSFRVAVDDDRTMNAPANDPDGITDADIPF